MKSEKSACGNSRTVFQSAAAKMAAIGFLASFCAAADAYIGPGAGLGVLGVIFAVLAGIVMAVVGLVLWPIRMIAHKRKARAAEEATASAEPEPVSPADAPSVDARENA